MNCCSCKDKLEQLTVLVKKLADIVNALDFDIYHGDGLCFESEVKISNASKQNLNKIILELNDL